jgi:Tol biopolymer transport system component
MRRDLSTGTETDLYQLEKSDGIGFFGLSLSPDGTQLAFNVNVPPSDPRLSEGPRALMAISVKGGTPRELHRGAYSCPQPRTTAWTRDGRYVLSGCGGRLWANPVDGGERRQLGLSVGGNTPIDVSPDGRHVAFTRTRSDPEVWTIKNLLTGVQSSR